MNQNQRRLFSRIGFGLLLFGLMAGTFAEATDFKVTSGSWTNADNWSAGVPSLSVNADIGTSTKSIAEATLNDGDTGSAAALNLGVNATNAGTLNLAGGSLTINAQSMLGRNGTGTVNQTGGTFDCNSQLAWIGYYAGSTGSYNLSSGLITNGWLRTGGSAGSVGTFTLSGDGVVKIGTDAYVGNGGTGRLTQSGGTWDNGGNTLRVAGDTGGNGTYVMTGGTLTNATVTLGYGSGASGTVTMNGGTMSLAAKTFTVGSAASSTGRFDMTGGVLTNARVSIASDAGSTGAMTLSGNAQVWLSSQMQVANSGSGNLLQTGGTLNGNNNIVFASVGSGSGIYTISGGVLTNAKLRVAWSTGPGTFRVIGASAKINVSSDGFFMTTTNATIVSELTSAGVSPIYVSSGTANVTGTVTVAVYGGVALLATNSHTLINSSGGFSGDFTTTNRSVFTVAKGSTTYTATLDAAQKQSANPLNVANPSQTFTSVNQGWVAVTTNGMSASNLVVTLAVYTNAPTATTLAQVTSYMTNAGLQATNTSPNWGVGNIAVTFTPTELTNSLAWDLSGLDTNLGIGGVAIVVPARGTVFTIR